MKNTLNGFKWNSLSPLGTMFYIGLIMTLTVFSSVAVACQG